jgi:hypothetical protein
VTPVSWQSRWKIKYFCLRGVQGVIKIKNRLIPAFTDQPHFLFNVLNTLYGTALQKAENTASKLKVSDMMRFMLHENNLDFIQMS